jgi:hypothetical protein
MRIWLKTGVRTCRTDLLGRFEDEARSPGRRIFATPRVTRVN